MGSCSLLFLIGFVVFQTAQFSHAEGEKRRDKAAKYFLKYGYFKDYSDSSDDKLFAATLKKFQKFAGLNVTGTLDDETKKQFEIPRCGLSDPIDKLSRRKRRYLLQGLRWELGQHKDRTLTWLLENTAKNLGRDEIRTEFSKALSLWQKYGNINFRESTDKTADILVKFGKECHGDPYCFDSKGGTLAHAFYPYPGQEIAGDVHFDDDEDYVIGKSTGTDLLWVATHELGHSLGLQHSDKRGAIMFPWYQGYKKDFDLTPDDIAGIRALYGAAVPPIPTKSPSTTITTQQPTTTTGATTTKATTTRATTAKTTTTIAERTTTTAKATTTTTTAKPTTKTGVGVTTKSTTAEVIATTIATKKAIKTTQTPVQKKTTIKPTTEPYRNNLRYKCAKHFDAAYISQKLKWMLVFAGRRMYLANRNGIRHGPLVAKNYFPHIKGNIDTALENIATGETMFFSGSNFWIFRGFARKVGPLSLEHLGFDKSVNKIDAALKWKRNGQHYLFSGNHYWRFNPSKPGIEKTGYPRLIQRHWLGIPGYLSEAITDFDQITRFAKGEQYYTLVDRAVRVDRSSPDRIGKRWMQCKARKVIPKTEVEDYKGPIAAEP